MKKLFTLLKVLACLLGMISLGIMKTQAQTPFDGPNYANHWINTSQTYVRVEVTKAGLHTVAKSLLVSAFPTVTDITKFRIYHRGKEVQILSTANDKLLFYGEPNDGAMDSLLFRPTSSRGNPYVSLYSDKGVYFITATSTSATPVTVLNQALTGTPEPYHLHSDTVVFTNEYSQSTLRFVPTPFQSYFENQETWTSVPLKGPEEYVYTIRLKNRHTDLSINPKVEVMINGRRDLSHSLEVSIGKDAGNLNVVGTLSFYGFRGNKLNTSFLNSYLNDDGSGVLKIKSTNTDVNDRTSVTYYSFTYPQQFIVPNTGFYTFNLPPATASGWSRVKINNITNETKVYDITNKDTPVELTSTKDLGGNFLEVMVQRTNGKKAKLFVSNTATVISGVEQTDMAYKQAALYNYLIVTSNALFDVSNIDYKAYRASPEGGGFNPAVVKIKDIYNQFNYGEPSPLAIRRFVDYMISDGNKEKYLLLIGSTISTPEGLVKDLPEQVPTVGFPGSDVLLVTGLGGKGIDVPAIAVGRISASNSTPQQVKDYLDKVKVYERDITVSPWRKNVLQMYGAKSTGEATTFVSYLQPLQSKVTATPFSGSIIFVDQPNPSGTSSNASIATSVNNGVGLLTYFGHGTNDKTWYDVGRVSNTSFGYSNENKYPVMYFNGCGIGNVFAGSITTPLSLDWILTQSKGAIAFITNSYLSYGDPSAKHLEEFYNVVFSNDDNSRKRIGDILNDVAATISSKPWYGSFDVQNLHQVILQGDPAMRILLTTDSPYLPVTLVNFKGRSEGNTAMLSWTTTNELNNSRFDIQVSRDAKSFETIGSVKGSGTKSSISDYEWKQTDLANGQYYYRLKQIDINGKSELSHIVSIRVDNGPHIMAGPNPIEKTLHLSGSASEEYDVKIYTVSGTELHYFKAKKELNLDFLSPGVYLLKIVSKEGLAKTEKFVKK